MIKKTIAYKDLDGNEKSEDFWFQITQAEFVKKALAEGGEVYLRKLERLTQATEKDGKEIMDTFEVLLRDAVGRREGDLFIKNEEIAKQFMYSGAYDAFFMELITTPDSGATFMRNMLPGDAQVAIDKALKERGMTVVGDAAEVTTPAQPTPESGQVSLSTPIKTPELQAAAPQLAEADKDDEPAWFKEGRYPTSKELMKAGPEEVALAMKMKNAKAFG